MSYIHKLRRRARITHKQQMTRLFRDMYGWKANPAEWVPTLRKLIKMAKRNGKRPHISGYATQVISELGHEADRRVARSFKHVDDFLSRSVITPQYRQGPVSCTQCNHEWAAVRPVEVVSMECPECGSMCGQEKK